MLEIKRIRIYNEINDKGQDCGSGREQGRNKRNLDVSAASTAASEKLSTKGPTRIPIVPDRSSHTTPLSSRTMLGPILSVI
ncbi:7708_t:CDS:2 [Cetraspora pellucida]|uniref:7708_t:CDS:1 n=1 Tax=Cetraspora pellucida TaxID=1433469 RepID=A0ACA9LL88_9GLOM|nr:7708_t:CDS:2 [Cetraspora pellucida]